VFIGWEPLSSDCLSLSGTGPLEGGRFTDVAGAPFTITEACIDAAARVTIGVASLASGGSPC
jgi:hypothetical protein